MMGILKCIWLFAAAIAASGCSSYSGKGDEKDASTESDTDTESEIDTSSDTQEAAWFNLGAECEELDEGELCWIVTAGGGGQDIPTELAAIGDERIAVSGYCSGPIEFGEGPGFNVSLDGHGICTAVFNVEGELIWAKDATTDDYIINAPTSYGIVGLSDGSIAITGATGHQIIFGEGEENEVTITPYGPVGEMDIYVTKYLETGELLWAKREGGIYHDQGLGMIAPSDGELRIVGNFKDIVVFGEGGENETTLTTEDLTNYGAFAGEYNEDGELIEVRMEPFGFSQTRDIRLDSNGNYYIAGRYSGNVIFGNGTENQVEIDSTDSYEMFVAKYGSSGELLWVETAEGENEENAFGVAVYEDGDIVVVGAFEYDITFDEGGENETTLYSSDGNEEIFIALYNSEGSLKNVKMASGDYDDRATGVAISNDGGFIVTGWIKDTTTFGEGEENETNVITTGIREAFLAKYTKDLKLEWVKPVIEDNTFSNEYIGNRFARIVTFGDSIFLAGRFDGTGVIVGEGEPNETTISSNGGTDYFVARYRD